MILGRWAEWRGEDDDSVGLRRAGAHFALTALSFSGVDCDHTREINDSVDSALARGRGGPGERRGGAPGRARLDSAGCDGPGPTAGRTDSSESRDRSLRFIVAQITLSLMSGVSLSRSHFFAQSSATAQCSNFLEPDE